MDETIAILTEQIDCLKSFHAINDHELIALSDGDFSNIQMFYDAREQIIQLLTQLEDKLQTTEEAGPGPWIPARGDQVAYVNLTGQKNALVQSILSQDLQIMAIVDSEKSRIIVDLQEIQKARRAMGAYRSPGQVRQLDEKA